MESPDASGSAMHMSVSTRKLRAMEGWLLLLLLPVPPKGAVVGVLVQYGGAERLRPSRDMYMAPSVPDAALLVVQSPLVLLLLLLLLFKLRVLVPFYRKTNATQNARERPLETVSGHVRSV